ncbi:hypothetical protein CsSME_00013014 [Camellia sinensis var. sinensis]
MGVLWSCPYPFCFLGFTLFAYCNVSILASVPTPVLPSWKLTIQSFYVCFTPKFDIWSIYPLHFSYLCFPLLNFQPDTSFLRFGPVNLFWSTRYDKAMTLFLTCLKEFAEFANSKDKENNIPAEKCFKLPYKIENDRVENYSITQSFNKQENWTKALKYTLCNLKWALYWFVGNSNFQPLSTTVSSHDVPAAGSLYSQRTGDSKSESRNLSNQ